MHKKEVNYKSHKDLEQFSYKYRNKIDEFLKSKLETKVVFLNADFGWGKTEFIKNNLKVKENCIYSPWLNKSDNYIEEIYYNVTKKDKGLFSSFALFISAILVLFTILFSSIISILMELSTDNFYVCKMKSFELICSNHDNLNILLFWIMIIIAIIIIILVILIFIKPIPIINFFKKDNGKYYENRIIKNILKKVDKVLVIEDIDRTDDIEDILIVANKLSEYIIEHNIDKYILITGDYIRMIRRISEPTSYDNNNLNLASYRTKGLFVSEKVISMRIDFSSIHDRINNLLSEYHLSIKLSKIEYDEIISFVKNRYLSIRFFIRFLEKYKYEIAKGNSLYHLLLKYYQEEKYFNVENNIINNSIYNISRFPNCINDIELLLQKGELILDNKKYSKISYIIEEKGNYDIITNAFVNLFFSNNNHCIEIFKNFYTNDKYPALSADLQKNNYNANNTVSIGQALRPINLKSDLDNFLLGNNNNEVDMMENILINKRCYFDSKNTSYNFENYKINNVEKEKIEVITNDDFIYGYIACFLRDNKKEIEKNYLKLNELILNLIR